MNKKIRGSRGNYCNLKINKLIKRENIYHTAFQYSRKKIKQFRGPRALFQVE